MDMLCMTAHQCVQMLVVLCSMLTFVDGAIRIVDANAKLSVVVKMILIAVARQFHIFMAMGGHMFHHELGMYMHRSHVKICLPPCVINRQSSQ